MQGQLLLGNLNLVVFCLSLWPMLALGPRREDRNNLQKHLLWITLRMFQESARFDAESAAMNEPATQPLSLEVLAQTYAKHLDSIPALDFKRNLSRTSSVIFCNCGISNLSARTQSFTRHNSSFPATSDLSSCESAEPWATSSCWV